MEQLWRIPWTEEPGGEKAREFQKNIYFCFIDYAKAFDCVDHNKLWKILKEMGPVGEGTTRRGTATPVHRPQRPGYF